MTYAYKRPTRFQLEERLQRVEELLKQGYNGKQISEKTGIALSTTERYVQTVTKRSKAKREEIQGDTLESRALIIRQKYKELAAVCQEILDRKNASPYDKIQAGKTLLACENNIYNMIKSGTIQGNNNQKMDIKDLDIGKEHNNTTKKKKGDNEV